MAKKPISARAAKKRGHSALRGGWKGDTYTPDGFTGLGGPSIKEPKLRKPKPYRSVSPRVAEKATARKLKRGTRR